MKLSKLLTRKGIIFLLVFSILVFIGDKINFSRLVGANNQFFTLFQFFGPVAGSFLGPVVGVLSVLIAEVASKLLNHASWNLVTVLRLLPMLFAAWYFGTKKDKISIFVPIAAIALFVAHPVGRQAWFFSLFWAIPILMKFAPKKYARLIVNGVLAAMLVAVLITNKSILAVGSVIFAALLYNSFPQLTSKSLGTTFTAHAVGGAMWNYIVPMTPAAWIALIPIVIFERMVFASGITISYFGLNTLLNRLNSRAKSGYVNVDKKHVLFRQSA